MVPPMRHSGALECTEQNALYHYPVQQGGGKEAHMAGRGGAAGEFGEDLPELWGTIGDHNIVQISWMGAEGGGRKLAVSGRKPEEG